MSKSIKKLGSDKTYKRPKTTYQENLSADEIADKLQGYEKVDNIADVALNTHLRYFLTQQDGSQTFRLGGFLHNKTNAEKYIMLTNGRQCWSVQVKNSVFFRKMSHNDEIEALHMLYKKKIDKKDIIIDKLKEYIENQNEDLDINLIINNGKKTTKTKKAQNREQVELVKLSKHSNSKTKKRTHNRDQKIDQVELVKRSNSKKNI